MTTETQPYDVIIGLEVHVQLLTESKMFCGCSAKFGGAPNTQTCPVCIGMPGTLPVMNRKAVELSIKAALGLHCTIARFTKWDRKNYYYPDLPKGYQISQYDLPLSSEGYLTIFDPKGRVEPRRIGIIRAHLEEDAGKSMHDEAAGKADSRIDLNRAGTPLLEIVSHPDMRSPQEAKAYLTELKLLLTYLGVSDCNMQEGSLRVDANINLHVHKAGEKIATPIVEVKNMNSFRAVERAMTYEAERQWREWQETGKRLGQVPKTTRGWDETTQTTFEQRSKEESSDYRYFPDPDLVPVTTTNEQIDRIRASLGELPADLRARLETKYGLPTYDADVIVNQGRAFADYYLCLADACGDGKMAGNWIQQDVLRTLNDREIAIEAYPVRAESLAALLKEVKAGRLDNNRGRQVLADMLESGRSVEASMKAMGIEQVDSGALDALCRELIEANPKIVADVKGGNAKAAAALIGQAKKKNPNVNPSQVRDRCLELIAGQ